MGGLVAGIIPMVIGALASVVMGHKDQPQQQEAAPPPPVPIAPVTPMPSIDDKAVADAKKKSIAAITARQGRASTILTGNSDPTGGGGSSTLG